MLLPPYLLLLSLLSGLPSASSTPLLQQRADASMVDLGYAKYQGTELPDSGVTQYLGVRFAAPPVGELRWRAPGEPVVEESVQDATAFKPICLGTGTPLPSATESEDCLFLNIFTPTNATGTASRKDLLPVWFFIQGGGYVALTNQNYNGTEVVRKSGGSIVFVQVNYRVGAWGFLAGEEVVRDGEVNVGILDQRMALRWVQRHIAKFGGDPNHVVLHGDSAGAGSVAIHLTAYSGHNSHLFHGAIGESPWFPYQPTVSELQPQFRTFAAAAGCLPNTTISSSTSSAYDPKILPCLRSLPASKIQTLNTASLQPGVPYFAPVTDGTLLAAPLWRLFSEGKVIDVPIIFGDDTDEGTFLSPNASSAAEVKAYLQGTMPHLTAENLTTIVEGLYLLRGEEGGWVEPLAQHEAYFAVVAKALGEAELVCPGLLVSSVLSSQSSSPPASTSTTKRKSKVWNYRVNIQDPTDISAGLGVKHTMELPAIFGVGNAGPNGLAGIDASFQTVNQAVVPVVMAYWISFVRALDVNVFRDDSAPRWEEFVDGGRSEEKRRLVLQTNATRMEEVPNAQLERCRFWREVGVQATESFLGVS